METSTGLRDEEGLRVALCARTRLYRDGLAQGLAGLGIDVAGRAAGAEECMELVRRVNLDVLLVDAGVADSVATIRRLARLRSGPPIVAVAIPDSEQVVLECVEAGAVGCVTADESLDDLVDAIARVTRGEARCSPRVVAKLVARLSSRDAMIEDEQVEALTARELEIGGLVAAGLSNKEIATALCIELPTVKNHVHNLLSKLRVQRRAQVGPRLRDLGLEPPESA